MDPQTPADSLLKWAAASGEGVMAIHGLLQWIEEGAKGEPPMDPSTLDTRMAELEWSMQWLREGVAKGRLEGGPPISETHIERLRGFRARIDEWRSSGQLPADIATLADQCIAALHGEDWRQKLFRDARR